MSDSERTEWDETVDEAIEVLIDESTEGFVLVGMQGGGEVHMVQATESIEQELLAVYMTVENVLAMAEQTGRLMQPHQVLIAAGHVAAQMGYLEEGAEWSNYRE